MHAQIRQTCARCTPWNEGIYEFLAWRMPGVLDSCLSFFLYRDRQKIPEKNRVSQILEMTWGAEIMPYPVIVELIKKMTCMCAMVGREERMAMPCRMYQNFDLILYLDRKIPKKLV